MAFLYLLEIANFIVLYQIFREAKKATQNQAAEHLKIKTAASQMV